MLPNYFEKLTSEETNNFIENHLHHCDECSETYKIMKEDLKVTTLYKEEEVKYMKKFNEKIKKLKLFKKILIIIVSILVILLGVILYRFLILTKIQINNEKTNEITNLYFYSVTDQFISEYWKKDGIIKQTVKSQEGEGNLIWWLNTNSNECYALIPESKTYIESRGGISKILPGSIANIQTSWERFLMAINPTISIDIKDYNNENCYYLKFSMSSTVEEIFDIKTGLLLYEKGQRNIGKDNESFSKYDYSLNTVTDDDVAKPDLSEYTLDTSV